MSTLYHYTSLQGLIGVITGKSVWASHCEYLNDSSEFIHALSFAKTVSGNIFMDDDYLEAFGWAVRDSLEHMIKHDIYVASFSENADLLSQWRGYCPQGSGVSIGFDSEILNAYCENQGYRLEKCIYDSEIQSSRIIDITKRCLDIFPQPSITREDYSSLGSKEQVVFTLNERERTTNGQDRDAAKAATDWLCEQVNECAPLIKHSGFHEESEWRIVAHNPTENIQYRVSKSHIVPYLVLPLIREYPEIIKEIYIGPNPNPHRCKKSVKQLLKSESIENVTTKISSIPFNSW
ncbi:DUF2971 domain-containing protein [Photobacterium leiognathi]|uniref:DUF2971 domain-containing protein n=1 Tax=Photobacterium leiognathi TaxID=553611 RepID=UPI00273A106E|nr:DUF2971 domain-containing protein [Photobacterium leiognathi]